MQRQEGTTILEVLIATMLLGVVAVIVFSSFGVGLLAASLAGGMNTATSIAEETLARLTAAPCGSSFQQATAPVPEDPRLARYRREVSVQRRPGANLWELTVTVTWTQERRERSVTLATLRHISAACEFVDQ
ncbi:MAG: type II secretion system protein [Chloroflexi bacterium]|nr:type II secretion system protein [Chloroflexota bacterium]